MGIIIKNNDAKIFKEIQSGDCFQLVDCVDLYMKVKTFIEAGSNCEWNALNLVKGKFTRIFDDRIVYKCNVTATIHKE